MDKESGGGEYLGASQVKISLLLSLALKLFKSEHTISEEQVFKYFVSC
jgi:hypothetical protein